MPVGGDVAVDEVVVADGELLGERVEIGRDAKVFDGEILLRPSIHPIAGESGIAVHAGQVAENFIEGAVFADDQKAVRRCGSGGRLAMSAMFPATTVCVS